VFLKALSFAAPEHWFNTPEDTVPAGFPLGLARFFHVGFLVIKRLVFKVLRRKKWL